MPASLQTIHLVFKTHLDIGFTGLRQGREGGVFLLVHPRGDGPVGGSEAGQR